MYFLGIIIASIIAYFIGSISWSIIIVKLVKGIDVRKVGSGNPGATNTLRVLGPWWGLVVALLDGFKVFAAAGIAVVLSFIPHWLFSQTSYFIPGLFVLIGHCWPVYYKFKGGKGVACFIGLITISNVLYFFIFFIVWWTVAAIWRKVSLSSLVAAVTIGLIIWIPWINGLNSFAWQWNSYDIWLSEAWINPWLRFSWFNYFHVSASRISGNIFASGMLEIIIVNLLGGGILIYRHSSNIRRLKNKNEPDIFPKLTKEEKIELKRLRQVKKLTRVEYKELKRLEAIEKEHKIYLEKQKELKQQKAEEKQKQQEKA